MKTYRILAGVNFTECSTNAVKYAIEMVQPAQVELKLLHCYSGLVPLTDLNDEIVYEAQQSSSFSRREHLEGYFHEKMEQLLDQLKVELSDFNSLIINVESLVLDETAVNGIIKISTVWSPDFIVIGTSLHQDLNEGIMVTVTSELIKKSDVPVLAVPADARNQNKLKDIVFVTNFRESDYDSLHRLIESMPSGAACIHCVHFTHEKADKWDYQRIEELQNYCKDTYRNQPVVCENVICDDVVESMDKYIRSKNIQLIVMTRQRRNLIAKMLHPDIAHKVLFHTEIPFLIFCEY
jgi:nucleotide-binding universal stress UspA family protein